MGDKKMRRNGYNKSPTNENIAPGRPKREK